MLNVKSQNKTHTLLEESQYSTTEAVYTGKKWIDGKKIYSIVAQQEVEDTSNSMTINISLPEKIAQAIDTVVRFNGIWKTANGISLMLPRGSNAHGSISVALGLAKTIWLEWGSSNSGGGTITIIMEVTFSEE